MMEKKKKFNFVDILVLVAILGIIFIIFNKDKLLKSNNANIVTGKSHIIMKAKSPAVTMDVVNAFKIGDKAMAQGKILDGEIIDVEYVPSKLLEIKGDKAAIVESDEFYDLYVTFDMNVNRYQGYMEIGNQEIKVGVEHYLSSENAVSYGEIVKIEELDD